MSENIPPLYDGDPDPKEALRVLRAEFRRLARAAMMAPAWRAWMSVSALIVIVALQHFWGSLYPMHFEVFLKFTAYGSLPVVLASAGYHLTARVVEDESKRRLYRALFLFAAIFDLTLTAVVENSSARVHKTEIKEAAGKLDKANQRLEAIDANDTKLLGLMVQGRPMSTATPVEKSKKRILAFLTNKYIATHDPVTPEVLAGAELPPSEWINDQLRQLGENWSVGDNQSRQYQQTAQISPSYGNLKLRCINLSEQLTAFLEHRNEIWRRQRPPYEPPQDTEKFLKWAQSSNIEFRAWYLQKVIGISGELATLHFHDERLDGILKDIQERTRVQQLFFGATQDPKKDLSQINMFDVKEISQKLLVLANKISQ